MSRSESNVLDACMPACGSCDPVRSAGGREHSAVVSASFWRPERGDCDSSYCVGCGDLCGAPVLSRGMGNNFLRTNSCSCQEANNIDIAVLCTQAGHVPGLSDPTVHVLLVLEFCLL